MHTQHGVHSGVGAVTAHEAGGGGVMWHGVVSFLSGAHVTIGVGWRGGGDVWEGCWQWLGYLWLVVCVRLCVIVWTFLYIHHQTVQQG